MTLVPADIHIEVTLARGRVYYIEDGLGIAGRHFYILLNRDPRNDAELVLVMATSNIAGTRRFARLRNISMTTVPEVPMGRFSAFTEPTCFKCNNAESRSRQYLVTLLRSGKLRVRPEEMPADIVDMIAMGVLDSPLVAEELQCLV
jgi:hypothetical protein